MIEYAKSKGAKGIVLAGMCCTANEMLMRHGMPIAGNYLQQELAIVTGAVDAMIVDVQCIMENLANVAQCYHTKIITTDPRAMIESATPCTSSSTSTSPRRRPRSIVRAAIDNFPNRRRRSVMMPNARGKDGGGLLLRDHQLPSGRHLPRLLHAPQRQHHQRPHPGRGRRGRLQQRPQRARLGPPDPDQGADQERRHRAHHGLLGHGLRQGRPAHAGSAKVYCGPGLAEVCETVGIPPVLHMGSCVDNSRILMAATAVVKDGGLGKDLSDLPAAGAAPEWMSEKAIAIGQYFVASGVYTVFGGTLPVTGAPSFQKHLFEELEDIYGGKWDLSQDPVEMAAKMIAHIDKKRKALGLDKAKESVLMDMADRQKLDAANLAPLIPL